MTANISPVGNSQFLDVNGNPLSGGKLYTYEAGTTTPLAAYTTAEGDVPQPNPVILNSLGTLDDPLYLANGVAYKIIVKTSAGVSLGLEYDDIYGVAAADTTADEWLEFTGTFTYVSSTSFTVSGDQTSIFQVSRKLKTQNTAGIAYSNIASATYSAPDTTVTVTNTFLTLDSGLSQIWYGFLEPTHSSIPETTIGTAVRVGTQAEAQDALDVYSTTEVDDAIDAAVGAINVAQIQPIAASVASNELTATINPTKLDFRSTTLTSGTVTTVNLASAASLVVPSGATLGTTNSVAARLAVLAINNAGTIEAAIINLSGGIDLSETGLISTTALSTGSDSANVAYSTTARTSVAYRVVGIIDITETTAGTWATAPTLVQGAGGQATVSMSTLGFGQTWQSVTGSRTSGTTYYNTTGKPIEVYAAGDPTASGGNLSATVNGVQVGLQGSPTSIYGVSISFIVPVGASYVITWSSLAKYAVSELR